MSSCHGSRDRRGWRYVMPGRAAREENEQAPREIRSAARETRTARGPPGPAASAPAKAAIVTAPATLNAPPARSGARRARAADKMPPAIAAALRQSTRRAARGSRQALGRRVRQANRRRTNGRKPPATQHDADDGQDARHGAASADGTSVTRRGIRYAPANARAAGERRRHDQAPQAGGRRRRQAALRVLDGTTHAVAARRRSVRRRTDTDRDAVSFAGSRRASGTKSKYSRSPLDWWITSKCSRLQVVTMPITYLPVQARREPSGRRKDHGGARRALAVDRVAPDRAAGRSPPPGSRALPAVPRAAALHEKQFDVFLIRQPHTSGREHLLRHLKYQLLRVERERRRCRQKDRLDGVTCPDDIPVVLNVVRQFVLLDRSKSRARVR